MSAIKLNFFILILFFTAGSLVYMGISKPTVPTPAEYSLKRRFFDVGHNATIAIC